jgi:hypothetical protein
MLTNSQMEGLSSSFPISKCATNCELCKKELIVQQKNCVAQLVKFDQMCNRSTKVQQSSRSATNRAICYKKIALQIWQFCADLLICCTSLHLLQINHFIAVVLHRIARSIPSGATKVSNFGDNPVANSCPKKFDGCLRNVAVYATMLQQVLRKNSCSSRCYIVAYACYVFKRKRDNSDGRCAGW